MEEALDLSSDRLLNNKIIRSIASRCFIYTLDRFFLNVLFFLEQGVMSKRINLLVWKVIIKIQNILELTYDFSDQK